MSEIKIGDRAKSVLSSFSKLNPTIRVRNDYLYAKSDTLTAVFTLADEEVKTESPFVIFAMPDFLNVLDMFEKPEITREGLILSVADATKKAVYLATDDITTPELNEAGLNLYNANQENAVFTCVIDEKNEKDITSAMRVISADALSIVCKDGKVLAKVENRATENFVEISLSGSASKDVQLYFGGSGNIMTSLFSGIYAVQCRECTHNNGALYLTKFINQSIQSTDGSLLYFTAMSEN